MQTASPPASTYFIRPWADALLLGGGSLLFLVACKAFSFGDEAHASALWTASMLSWVVNWPHFAATSHRLYGNAQNARQFPLTAYLVPCLVAVGALAAFLSPEDVAPAFIKFYLIWSPYHFSGQTFGITLLYAKRSGAPLDSIERRALAFFVFGTYLTQTALSETATTQIDYYGVRAPLFGIAPWIPLALKSVMYAAGAIFIFLLFKRRREGRAKIHWIVLMPAVTQYCWFVLSADMRTFQLFVPLFHSLQYAAVAATIHLAVRTGGEKSAPSARPLAWATARWWGANMLGGAFMFYLLPLLLAPFAPSPYFSTSIVLASVQLHHFFVDGVIWKLKDAVPTSPMMFSLNSRATAGAATAPSGTTSDDSRRAA